VCSVLREESIHKYFDFDGLIDDQVSQLTNECGAWTKLRMSVEINLTPHSSLGQGLQQELEIFRELEQLTQPAFQQLTGEDH